MSLQNKNIPLTLASKSKVRTEVLAGAGLNFDIITSGVDEDVLKQEHNNGRMRAEQLAIAKAQAVAALPVKGLIIGADQVLSCDGRLFDKPANKEEAKQNLGFLRGKPHSLLSGLALVRDGETIWSYIAEARLTMRDFSDDFLESYLAASGDSILSSVGGYQLEAHGVQLFSEIEGDYFTILGMPLIPLLEALRQEGAVLA